MIKVNKADNPKNTFTLLQQQIKKQPIFISCFYHFIYRILVYILYIHYILCLHTLYTLLKILRRYTFIQLYIFYFNCIILRAHWRLYRYFTCKRYYYIAGLFVITVLN